MKKLANVVKYVPPKAQRFIFDSIEINNPHTKDYIFSIVVAVYNAAEFLTDTIDSVISQTIGFEKNIQLILINDGSTDHSLDICSKYAAIYPDNILVIDKKNGGVSSARNAGVKYAKGTFINFLDSDDYLDKNVCEVVKEFFDKHGNYVDIVAIKNRLFGSKTGESWYNQMYNQGERVIDLWKDPRIYLNSVNNCFIHKRISNQIYFDEKISISEDLKLINTLLFNKYSLGVTNKCFYNYRVRLGEDTLVTTAKLKRDWYDVYLDRVALWLFDYSIKRIGFIPKFLQHTILRDLFNRFQNNTEFENVITSEKARQNYKQKLFSAIKMIDSDVITNNSFLNSNYQIYFLKLKYDRFKSASVSDDGSVTYDFGDVKKSLKFYINFDYCKVIGNKLYIEGYAPVVNITDEELISIKAKCGNNPCKVTMINGVRNNQLAFGDEYTLYRRFFKLEITVNEAKENVVEFFVSFAGLDYPISLIGYGQWFPLTMKLPDPYYYKNGICLSTWGPRLVVSQHTLKEIEEREKKTIEFLKSLPEDVQAQEALKYREKFLSSIGKTPKELWIISDRHVAAGDNGEAFYRYASKRKEAKCYFAMNSNYPDYQRLQKEGFNLVDMGSQAYKDLFMEATSIITSYMERSEINPIQNEYLKQFFTDKKYVFLQHGVTKDDVSPYYTRRTMKMELFVTTAVKEYESIISNNNYLSDESITKLVGFPRYDLLDNSETKKVIVVMPTWRNKMVRFGVDGLDCVVDPKFKDSFYFRFYHELLSNKKLHKILNDKGYVLKYFPHNNMMATNEFFNDIEGIEIVDGLDRNYNQMFKEAALMITDYSSTAFDFAYLRKPIIYCQGDEEQFFSSHTYVKGYFSYRDDGFGPVLENVNEVVEAVKKIVENDCKCEEKYLNRINALFKFNDRDNSKRVYEAILQIK